MAASSFRVIFASTAFSDLEEIVSYWRSRDEPERGEDYAHDLQNEAARRLCDPVTAHAGHHLVKTSFPEVQELPVFKRSYRILYRVRGNEGLVEVLRFWHSHRDEPFQD